MTDQNIETAKKTLNSFVAGDIPGLLEAMTDDIQWDHSGPEGVPFNRVYSGRDDVLTFFQSVDEHLETLKFEPQEYYADGDRVVTLGSFAWKVKSTGKKWDSAFAMRFTFRDGGVPKWDIVYDRGAELAAFQA